MTRARRTRIAPLQSLRVRIGAAFLASLLAMAGALWFPLWQQGTVAQSLALITEGYLPLATVSAELERDRSRIDNDVQRLLRDETRPGTGAQSPTFIYTEAFQRKLAEAQSTVTRAKDIAPSGTEQAALNKVRFYLQRIDNLARDYQKACTRFVQRAEDGRIDPEVADQLRQHGSRLADEVGQLGRHISDRVTGLTEETERDQVRATAIASGLAAVAVLFTLLLIGIVLYALRPIRTLTSEVQRLAAGDYSGGRVEVRGRDEIALLAAEFNAMVRALEVRDRTLVERADELNRLSRYLASVVDSLQDALMVVESGAITLANPAARDVWGARDGATLPAPLLPALATGSRLELQRDDGSLHEVRTTPFGDRGAVVVAVDITEQTETRERLARTERLALVGQMLAQITHEVRNPLNAMSLNAELLSDELGALDGARSSDAWASLETITSEIDRLTAVTAHYLQLARRPPAELAPLSLPHVVDEVTRLLELELAQQGVALVVDAPPVPVQLADGNQIRQALINVVHNAVEAGARNLRLHLDRVDGEVQLSLSDDGPGMTRDEVERACDPFFSTKVTGTGLGLAITKQILEDHGGTVRVESELGGGTTVTLVLPDRPAPARESEFHAAADHPGR